MKMNSCRTFKQIEEFARSKSLPLIPLRPSDIAIIGDPKSFFNSLIEQIRLAENRICLSALYLGVNSKESSIVNNLDNQIQNKRNLGVSIALDSNRASRRDKDGRSSISILDRLVDNPRFSLNLIETRRRSFLNWILSRIQKWNEIASTYHAKFMVFDDNLILTGANLSNVYFDVRRDRYLLLRKCPMLADYFCDFLQCVNQSRNSLKDQLESLNNKFVKLATSSKETSKTYAIPLVQFGQSGITDKEDFVVFLNSLMTDTSELYLASGYFNPSPKISSLNLKSVLVASEEANNFSSGSGLLKYVPKLYSALYEDYFIHHKNCKLQLYNKPDWSFHAKGLWLENLDDIYIHIIGSSNYNYRSAFRDLEAQIVILTNDKDLIRKLKEERQSLWKGCGLASVDHFAGLNLIHKAFAKLFRSYL